MARSLSPDIEAAIARTSAKTGFDPSTLRTFVMIESGGNPANVTGSYKGLLQLSNGEFRKNGGQGDIFDPEANLAAGATKLKAESDSFAARYGRAPTAAELYMMHQQGVGGSAAHWANPDKPAWENMASTGEGQAKGAKWAKAAIWGNIPDADKARFGSVDNVTSKDFTDLWTNKVARFGGDAGDGSAPVRLAAASTPGSAQPSVAMSAAAPATPDASNAKPFALASSTNAEGSSAPGVPAQAASPASPPQSFFGSLAGLDGGATSNRAIASLDDDPQRKADEERLLEQMQSLRVPGVKPLDISRIAMILQNRQRLGTA